MFMPFKDILLIVIAVIVTASAIYLTPLRYTSLLEPKINDIDATEFHALYKENPEKYVFVDVRSLGEYDLRHAEGAESMPLHTLYDERKNLPKKDKEVILICTGGRASGVGFGYLQHYGFSNISRIEGGIDAWEDAGLPVVYDVGI